MNNKEISEHAQKPKIRNLVFDISGVFISSDEEPILREYAKRLGVSYKRMKEAYDKHFKKYERGELTQEEFTGLMFNEVGKEKDMEFWKKRITFKHKFPEMFDFIKGLKKYKLYFVSNEGKEYWEAVDKKLRISENFIDGVVSYQVGMRKPDEKIFLKLLRRNNLKAQECVFIDDSAENLEGARKLGMKVLHYSGVESLKKNFEKMRIMA